MATLDQVVRLEQFRQRHPDVDIQHHLEPAWHWKATWQSGGTTTVVADYELSGLLNRLESALS
jgi:hypothetical protein